MAQSKQWIFPLNMVDLSIVFCKRLPEGIPDELIDDHGLMTLSDHPPKDSCLLGGEILPRIVSRWKIPSDFSGIFVGLFHL